MTKLTSNLGSNKRFEFISHAYPGTGTDIKFDVVEMVGTEVLATPYRFELILVSDDSDVDLKKMLANPAQLRIFAANDVTKSAPYNGVLAQFEQLNQVGAYYFYRAVLVPKLWLLTKYQASNVFVDATLQDIFKAVIGEENRLTSADYELALTSGTTVRNFTFQYQETHLNFLSRWFEKEGMFYFFTYDDSDKEKCVIADENRVFPSRIISVRYVPDGGTDTTDSLVRSFVCRRKPLPKRVNLQDFNPAHADLKLNVSAIVDDDGVGEMMLYGEHFTTVEAGERYAKIRSQELICGAEIYEGRGIVVGLRSGSFIEMSSHYRASFNRKYLITNIVHEGSQAATLLAGIDNAYTSKASTTYYLNTFNAIADDVPYRAPRVTPIPHVAGSISGSVDAGDSTYADLDDAGQYKVQVRGCRTPSEGAGPKLVRVRMATPYSGSNHGVQFPLHQGAEVLLSFIDGDPDQPVIMNAAPNSENPAVVNDTNAKVSRILTAGGNRIEIDDTKGAEKITLSSPNGNATTTIGGGTGGKGNSTITTGSSNSITAGASSSISVGPSNSIAASSSTGFSASASSKINFGLSSGYSCGEDISWNSKYSKKISFDEGTGYSLSLNSSTKASDSVTLSAGNSNAGTNPLIQASLDAMKTKVQVGMAVISAVNFALGGTAAGLLTGKGEPDAKETYRASDASGYGSKPYDYSLMIGNTVGNAVSTGVGVGVLNRTFAALLSQYQNIAYVSNMKLDDQGISQIVDAASSKVSTLLSNAGYEATSDDGNGSASAFTAYNDALGLKASGTVGIDAPSVTIANTSAGATKGFSLSANNVAMWNSGTRIDAAAASMTILADATNIGYQAIAPVPALNPAMQVQLTTAAALRDSTHAAWTAANNNGNTPREAVAEALRMYTEANNGYLTLRARADAQIADATRGNGPLLHGLSVDNSGTKMLHGNAEVGLTNAGVNLKFGTVTVSLAAMGMSVDGPTIKLG
jgi:type VI secretion system secreted protein VgrG